MLMQEVLHWLFWRLGGARFMPVCYRKGQHAGVKKSPSTLCLARIEGLERLPLTTAEDHSGQRQEAYGNIATFVSPR